MKYIGQHIYDFLATFRLDATFKSDVLIGQTDISGSSDKKGIELHSRSSTEPGIELTGDNASATTGPFITLANKHDGDGGTFMTFTKKRLGGTDADGDAIASLNFSGTTTGGSLGNYACIKASKSNATTREGKIQIAADTPDLSAESGVMTANVITGEGNGSGVVDVTLAAGAASTTTVAGDMTVTGGDITLSGTGRIQGVDTVSASTDAANKAYVDGLVGDGLSFDGSTANGLLTYKDADEITTEANATYDGADLTLTSATSTKPILSIENTTADANAGELKLIGRRSADASVIAGAGDDAGTISFIGENAKSGPDPETIPYGKIASESSAVTDGAEMGKITMSVGANLSAVGGSLGFQDVLSSTASVFGETTTFGSGSLMSSNTFDATITNFTSSVATGPIFGVYNYTDDAGGPQFTIGNLRGGIGGSKTDGSDNDSCGVINFAAYDDGTPTQTTFAKIEGIAKDVSNGAEEGKLTLNVASHDGEIQPGLTIESGDAEDEVDATIGNGASSTTTVAGDLSITGRLILDSASLTAVQLSSESFSDSDNVIMTAAAIDDRINAAGGGSSVTADPFSTTVIKVLPNQWIINDDAGRPLFVEDDTSNTLGVRCFTTTDEMYAWQKLPSGYKATHVQVHASASTSSAVSVRSYNYQTGADNAVSATTGDLNANIDITDIPSSATQDLVIKVSPASGSTIVYGATVTIATI
tara:strand:+ start:2158 stop:4278 length:2121 start_codon:yes stop_codon:yes gene_type:complete